MARAAIGNNKVKNVVITIALIQRGEFLALIGCGGADKNVALDERRNHQITTLETAKNINAKQNNVFKALFQMPISP